jgi:OmpA-OmpF porin, OOP family
MLSRIALVAALAAIGGTAAAQTAGPAAPSRDSAYVTGSARQQATGAFGQCVRTGYWTPADAAEPCDATARAAATPIAVAKPEPVPQAAPAPAPQAEAAPLAPPRPVIEKVSLSSDVLFEFGKATLRDEGKQKLDELAGRITDANIEEIVAVGHADRIASEQFNQQLSEQRAQAVKAYLVDKGLASQLVKTEGKGESQPVTNCAKMGAERASNRKLVQCLQPDRRVDIEVFGTRQASGTGGTGATGAAGGTGTTGTTSGAGASTR